MAGKNTRKGPGVGRTPRYERAQRMPHGMASYGHKTVEGETVPKSTAMVRVTKPAMKPTAAWRAKGGRFALGAGTIGGTAYLTHHFRKPKASSDERDAVMAKYLDPFSGDTVEFVDLESVGKRAAVQNGQYNFKVRDLTPEEKAKNVRRNTTAGGVIGGIYGGALGALHSGKGAAVGAAAGGLGLGALARHGAKKQNQGLELQRVGKAVQGFAIRDVSTSMPPKDLTSADHGLDLRQIKRKSTLPTHTASLTRRGNGANPAGAAVGDGQPGVRVRSPHFRGKHGATGEAVRA